MTINEFKIKLLSLKNKLFYLSLSMLNNRNDAEDTVQEVYIKIWEIQDKLDDIKNLEAFIMAVTRNLCLDKLKLVITNYFNL